ncbi:MAG TPA: protein kinase [Planctomycetota bacterium]|nr:protein kinase [Planctomycetota bacterium]
MNEREVRSDPEEQRRAADVPAREANREEDPTSGAGVDATVRVGAGHVSPDATETSLKPKTTVMMPASKPLAPKDGELIANRFIVRRLLGQGGMGRVYAVQDKQIEGRDVALKVLLPKYSKSAQFRKLFFQEVRAAQGFVSEYICQVRDTGETEDGSLFLTMDLIDGESLRTLLDREKILGERQALEITRQVLLGLQSGHDKGFVHRDIKPPNVMLASNEPKTDDNPFGVAARLLDFGIAGLASEIEERSRAGTVMYMSPEQAGGERLDPRSDLFAVGVLLFEMLSGRRPFAGSSTRALVQSVLETNLTERLSEIPNLSKPVRKLLERALQKERDKRFQSANDFASAIEKSAAYKLPKEVPVWAYAGLALFGVAALGEGFVLFGRVTNEQLRADEMEQLRVKVGGFAGLLSEARQEVERTKDKELQLKQEELQSKETAFVKVNDDYRRTAAELEKARSENSALTQQLSGKDQAKIDEAQIQAQINESQKPLNMRITDLEKQKDQADGQIKELQQKSDQLAKENGELKMQLKPEGRKAETFDKILTAVEEDRGDTALVQMADAAREFSIFLTQELDGVAFLSTLSTASAELRKHVQSVERDHRPDMESVTRALAAYDTCKEAFTTFPSQAKSWIKFQSGNEPSPDRVERARKAVDSLGQKLASVRQGADQAHEAAWASIASNAAVDDAAAIFAHADRYHCADHLARAAAQLVDSLRKLAPSDVPLDTEGLKKYTALGEWVKRLNTEHFPLENARETDLRLLEFAQRWYDADASNDEFEWKGIALPPLDGPSKSWKHVLQLQHALAQPSSGYPIGFRGLTLTREVDEQGNISWIEDSDVRKAETPKYWEIHRRVADTDGQFSADSLNLALERVDETIRVQNGNLIYLDLKLQGSGVSVEPLPPLFTGPMPKSLISTPLLQAFRSIYAAPSAPTCLVVADGTATRWFSPKFGLVREKYVAGWTRDLVYWRGAP